jgi:VWFA-related protein
MVSRVLVCFLITIFVYAPWHAAGQSESAEPAFSLHAGTDLVVEDVVVTDAHGNPIHNLTASDFTVLENGHPQKVKVFGEHTASMQVHLPPMPQLQPGTFTNDSAAPTDGPLNILLLDKLNTPLDAQSTVINEVLKYLKGPPTSSRIAILTLTTQLRLLQGFTSDPAVLRAVVEGRKGLPGGSLVRTNPLSGDEPGADNSMTTTAAGSLGSSPDTAMMLSSLQDLKSEQQSFQLMLRARYTLDAFNQLARYLSSLPGRKNVIWFSGGFPISVMPDGGLQDPFSAVSSAEEEYRDTVNLLARSQVAVYPVDARGLMAEPMLSAANSNRNYVKDPGAMAKSQQKFFQATTAEHGMMSQMAEATGGAAFVDANDLKTAISKAIDAGSNYYTITYTPTDHSQSDDYRKIEIKLDRQGANLAYRHSYFANAPAATAHHDQAQNAKTDLPAYSYIRSAMLHGAPDPVELVFVANVRPSIADTEAELAQGNQGNPKVSGPYRRYTVTFVTNPRGLNCAATSDGTHHCVLEFLTFVYDADGTLINTQTNGMTSTFSPARFASFQKSQLLTYRQQISVPVKGEYYLRIGLRDDTSGNVGALELPIAAIAKLPPIPLQTPAAGSGSGTAPK